MAFPSTFVDIQNSVTAKRTGLVASETVKLQVKGSSTHTSNFNSATIRFTPVRVS